MNNTEKFSLRWEGKGNEISDTPTFWLELLHDVLGIENPGEFIQFEKRVSLDHTSFIDAYIPSTKIIIEQKSYGVNLSKEYQQSDKELLTPYEQAKRYSDNLPYSERARWIIVCDFGTFLIHDMEHPREKPEVIYLKDLPHSVHKLKFLVDTKAQSPRDIREEELSVKAGELVGKLYKHLRDPIDAKYPKAERNNKEYKDALNEINVFCVRLVFLLYAEDSELFLKSQFHDYLKPRKIMADEALEKLFTVLKTKPLERPPLKPDLSAFPYVNGSLFDKAVSFPLIDDETFRIIIEDMAEGFDWSGISPTIFGAIFESTLKDNIRKSGGMHYTSPENIHKVIDPLFLDGLNVELDDIISAPPSKNRTQKLRTFHAKLASLRFLDPACGSGNFLTESFLSLRRIENKILRELSRQITFTESEAETAIKVSISQFYGIEINDFAVAVAKTALWIAEAQMWNETKNIINFFGDLLPLKSYNNIVKDNALTTDWKTLVPSDGTLYIIGNPPYRGARVMDPEQKKDITALFKGWDKIGDLDYVCCWYKKAFDFIKGTKIHAAFVSTNSINQGDIVSIFWKPLTDDGLNINFAYKPFIWDSEASDKAHVTCSIIGFSCVRENTPRIFTVQNDGSISSSTAGHINAYLLDAPDQYIFGRTSPLCSVPAMRIGNMPIDGGHYLFTEEQYEEFIRKEPEAKQYFHVWYGSKEFIHNTPRMCLYLGSCTPQQIANLPECRKRVEAVKQYRLNSNSIPTRAIADTPTRFHVETFPKGSYIVVPETSSEKRKYIPIGFLDETVMCSNRLKIIPNATLYHFGVLTSRVHMAWMRVVTGRLEMRYSYSITLVYNCFVWPEPSPKQRTKIEQTAQEILNARAKYPDSSFAALYDDTLMPPELRRAHAKNDEAVCSAYGWDKNISEEEIVAGLFVLYREITNQNSGNKQ